MKVLVTGGTGFVGREILQQLHDAGHQIRLLVRQGNSPAALEMATRYQAEIREANILDAASLPQVVSGTDAVIHLLGIISECHTQTFENIHTRATQNIVGATVAAGVRRFIHMSALGTRPNAVSRYHQTKWAAEQAVNQSALDWTIFRPSLIYGPQDHFVNLFANLAKYSPVLPVIGRGRAVLQPVMVEDVAKCFVGALDKPQSIRHIFDVGGPERLTLPQILRLILATTGRKRLILHVPIQLARLLARLLEFIYPEVLGKAPPLNRDQLLMLQEDNVGEEWLATGLFKLRSLSFAEGIERYLNPDWSCAGEWKE
jgi:uncharacterized protein YbjT (DUF2867 family)